MPVDVSEAAEQAMEKMGVSEEDIRAQVEAATISGDKSPAKDETEAVVEEKDEKDETEVVDEEEVEEETPEPKSVPISRFNKVYREMKEMERYLQAMVTEREQLLTELRRGPKEVEPEVDWDAMTPGEMANKIQQNTTKTIEEVVTAVMQREIAPMKSNLSLEAARKDMSVTAEKYEDYWDYKEPMIEIANAHPDLTAEEVYFLASRNPKKVKESVTKRMNETIKKKKKAITEKHSSPSTTTAVQKRFTSVKDIARQVMENMDRLNK